MEMRTPLYNKHLEHSGKMVSYAGYLMPVQYSQGVMAEHKNVRTKAGLFDVSHMGEVILAGKSALDNLQSWLTNDMEDLDVGGCRYSPMCNEEGGIIDDLLVYCLGPEKYMLVVNAANRHKDVQWMQEHLHGFAVLSDESDDIAELALQGPNAPVIMEVLTKGGMKNLPDKYYTFLSSVTVAGVDCLVSKTGYTGELGYEIYCHNEDAARIWDAILDLGELYGVIPCGLGARDTLRLEASLPLYGQEMSEEITPIEAGLSFFVKTDKTDFIGKEALLEKINPQRRRTGLRMTGKGIAREGSEVYLEDRKVGVVTSGTKLPYLDWAGAMALLDCDVRDLGTKLMVDVRGRQVEAEVVSMPFYKRK